MRILVKVGGAQLEETGPRAQLCLAIAAARKAGHEVVVVHGGGNQIRQLGKDLGIEERYHDGLRVTDARTADVVLMVLGGQVNRTLVAALQRAGVPSVASAVTDNVKSEPERKGRLGSKPDDVKVYVEASRDRNRRCLHCRTFSMSCSKLDRELFVTSNFCGIVNSGCAGV